MIDLSKVLQRAGKHVRVAGARIQHVSKTAVQQKSGHYNFVTETDIAIEEYLKTELLQVIPGSRFFAEEQENETLTDDYTWMVDPIDGTTNFIRHRRASCVSVALLKDKVPVLALIYQPYVDEMFTAIKGKGAYLNGRPIQVSERPFEIALADLGTSPYYAEYAHATAFCFEQFLTHGGDIRRCGSAALDCCDIACGRADIYVELKLSPWDYAAGSLLIMEAGGKFAMPYAPSPDYGKSACILASNPLCYENALEIVQRAKELIV